MNSHALTEANSDALKPAADRDVLVWDDELPGFGVRCRRSGAKVYFLKYRTAGGRQRWLTLGQHGLLTPDAARRKALREKAAIGDGDDLTRSDIKAWHQGMSATPYEANRALAYCSRMLSLAATDWELREDNPCIGVKRFPEHARERFFTDDELAEIGAALSTAEAEGLEVPDFILLVRLLATTGMRLGEALALTWPNVDLPGRAIRSRRENEGWRSDSTSRCRSGSDP